MQYSLNQIEHTCRKAVRGAGCAWGVAEDAGRAVRWLEMMQFPGVVALAELLQSDGGDGNIEVAQQREDAIIWKSTNGDLSPLVAGPCLGDYINSSQGTNGCLTLESISHPLLYIGFIGAAVSQANNTMVGIIGATEFAIQPDKIQIDHEQPQFNKDGATGLQLIFKQQIQKPKAYAREANITSREAAIEDWQVLEKFAHRTYVEATDASRIAGAGAGLSDND